MEFNPEINDVQVLSLHCYEQDKLKVWSKWEAFTKPTNRLQEGREYYGKVPQLHVDTQQRCAAMLIFDRKLVILPFRREESVLLEMFDDRCACFSVFARDIYLFIF